MKNTPCLKTASFFIMLVGLLVQSSTTLAAPTLVVDIDTGSMEIHVGDTGPLAKAVLAQSGGNGGSTLTAGDWGPLSGFQISSVGNGLNNDGDSTPDVLAIVFPETPQNYAEGTFSTTTFLEGAIFSLDTTYNTTLDLRDLLFVSDNGGSSTDWNTLYLGTIPEPSSMAIMLLGLVGSLLAGRNRDLQAL